MAKWIGLAAALLLACMLPIVGGRAEAAQERYKAEVELEFKYEAEAYRIVPQARITKTYFEDGRKETELREFPEQARPVPRDAEPADHPSDEDDPALTKRFFPGCAWSGGDTYVRNTGTGLQAYAVDCDSTVGKKLKPKFDQGAVTRYFIYKYDLSKNRMTLLNQVQTHYGDPLLISWYLNFGAYTLQDSKEIDYNKRQIRAYSLSNNQLLARFAERPRESEDGKTLVYTEYTKLSGDPKVLAKAGTYNQYRGEYFQLQTFALKPDGTRTKQTPVPEFKAPIAYEVKIGSMTYVVYKKPNSEDYRVGYRTSASSAIQPLSRADAAAKLRFSQFKRFALVYQQKGSEKTLRVVDAATAKVIADIPNVEESIFKEVGDSIALFQFEQKDYYIHFPTGIITRNLQNSQLIQGKKSGYIGDQSKLITMQAPPQMYVNGQAVKFAGQGPFLTKDNRWYIEVNDFAKAAGATVTRNANQLTIARGFYTMTVGQTYKSALRWAGQTFVPLETLNEKLGMAGGFLHPVFGKTDDSKMLNLFSKDLTESEVLEHPDLYEIVEDSPNQAGANYYVMQNGKPAAKHLSKAHRYKFLNSTSLIFEDGRLVSVAAIGTADARTLRNIIFDIGKFDLVIKTYGTPKATVTDGKTVRWYEVEGKTIVFETYSNSVSSVYYIMN